MPQLWLIEGLPGSGKTSAAERLTALCHAKGLSTRWWLEEAKDHPVLPSALRKLAASPEFPALCVEAFRSFVNTEAGILILEGSAFQNTVRFMFANARPHDELTTYLAAWVDAVSSAEPRLMMFHIEDPQAHFTRFIAARRGSNWIRKLVAYVESTPVAKARDWSGLDGFVAFWTTYQALCLSCATTLPWPVEMRASWSETRRFDDMAVLDFFIRQVSPAYS
jgi:hypothetical protein